MPTPPTLISYTQTASWAADGGASQVSASISWQTGDVIAVIAGAEDTGTLGLPTATGLTFTSQRSNTAAGSCASQCAAAIAGSTSSGAVTVTWSGAVTKDWGFGVWVWRGSAGIGNSFEGHTTATTINLTPTGADGAIVYGIFDFSAAAVLTITPAPTNTRQRVQDPTFYSIYVADLADQTSTGATAYGLTTGTGVLSIVALEIKAAASSLTTAQEAGIFAQELSGQLIGQSWDR